MNDKRTSSSNAKVIAVVILIIVILFPIGYSLVNSVFAGRSPDAVPFIEMPDSKYDKCVRDTAYMRFHHWELLRQIRNEVVRDGIRGEVNLNSCRKCHPNRERFCNECHEAVSLAPDCWGCHYYPETPDAADDVAQMGRPRPYPRRTELASKAPGGE
jgi:hypothetical protein